MIWSSFLGDHPRFLPQCLNLHYHFQLSLPRSALWPPSFDLRSSSWFGSWRINPSSQLGDLIPNFYVLGHQIWPFASIPTILVRSMVLLQPWSKCHPLAYRMCDIFHLAQVRAWVWIQPFVFTPQPLQLLGRAPEISHLSPSEWERPSSFLETPLASDLVLRFQQQPSTGRFHPPPPLIEYSGAIEWTYTDHPLSS